MVGASSSHSHEEEPKIGASGPGSTPPAPPERRLRIMELLLHTNFNMILGKCSLDQRDAEHPSH